MHQRSIILTVALFALIVAGMFMFAYLKKSEQAVTEPDATGTQDDIQNDVRYDHITRIDGKHYFIDGVHTIVGEIQMPTPCDLLESNVIVAESYPEQVTLDFSVINNADACVQVITPARFKVSAEVSPDATFKALFQNRVVELNLIPAPEGEIPDEFEVFLKG